MLLYYNFRSVLKCVNYKNYRYYSDRKLNVLFFGTDNFSLYSLDNVYNKYVSGNLIGKLEVVTNLKNTKNNVHKYAIDNNLHVHQWPLLSVPENKFHIGIVVSFGHLIPASVIRLFPFGILNVHASLLPKWRGAAPIVHSLLHGETVTGVTIMRIQPKHFDIGEIILQKEVSIGEATLQTELHHTLATVGAEALIECLETLPECLHNAKQQDNRNATYAPRISKHLSIIKWKEKTANEIYNLFRALYGIFPLQTSFHNLQVKLYDIGIWKEDSNEVDERLEVKIPGHFKYIKRKNIIRVWCSDGSSIYFKSVSLPGKKIMSAVDFRNGFLKHRPDDQLYFTSDDFAFVKEVVKSKL